MSLPSTASLATNGMSQARDVEPIIKFRHQRLPCTRFDQSPRRANSFHLYLSPTALLFWLVKLNVLSFNLKCDLARQCLLHWIETCNAVLKARVERSVRESFKRLYASLDDYRLICIIRD